MARPVHRLRHLQALLKHERDLLEQSNAHWISWSFGGTAFAIVAAITITRFSLWTLILLGVLSPLLLLQIASTIAKHREALGLVWSPEGSAAMEEIRGVQPQWNFGGADRSRSWRPSEHLLPNLSGN